MSKQPSSETITLIGSHRKIQQSFGFAKHEEKSVELFAGSGGFGAGAALAGLHFDVAINHNPAALAVHKANAPWSTQMINDVFEHHPFTVLAAIGSSPDVMEEVKNWRKTKLSRYLIRHLHLSPDCTLHSRAKGKKKVLKRHAVCGDDCSVDHTKLTTETAERIRGLAWVGIGWAAVARPRRITLENVREWLGWGPTMIDEDGDVVPDPSREAQTFNAFKEILSTGIDRFVDMPLPKLLRFANPNKLPKRKPKQLNKSAWNRYRIWLASIEKNEGLHHTNIRAWHHWKMEHPTLPEIRKFLKPFLGEDYCEDSLISGLGYDVEFKELVASDYGSPTSRKRLFMIARCDGVPIRWPKITHGDPDSQAVIKGTLLPWHTAGECIDWNIAAPSIFDSKEEIKEQFGINVKRPLVVSSMRRIALGIVKYVIITDRPYIVKVNHGGEHFRGQDTATPLQTLTSKNGYGVAIPFLQSYYGPTEHSVFRGGSLFDPLNVITAGGQRHALCVPYVTGIDNQSSSGSVWQGNRPLTTITTENRHAITAAYIVNAKGTKKGNMPIGNTPSDPTTTITTSDTHGVIMASLANYYGQSIGQTAYTPLNAITGQNKTSVIAAHCIKMKGTNIGYACNVPTHTITSGGLNHGLIESLLGGMSQMSDDMRYKAWQVARMLEEYADVPVPMLGGIPLPRPSWVTTQSGEIIADIGMRMFSTRELYRASGFREDFVYDPEIEVKYKNGKVVRRKVNKKEAVRMVGNAVPPHFATALITALDEAEEMYGFNPESMAA